MPHTLPRLSRPVSGHCPIAAVLAGLLGLLLSLAGATNAAEEPAPEPAGGAAPTEVRYTLDRAGRVAIVIDDAAGRRVRNLIADAPRLAGTNVEMWDGRDDAGNLLPPGDYRFKAAVTPPLDLSYEFTLYNSGDPPWWTIDNGDPRPAPGGWGSDHSPPMAVTSIGEVVFIGCDVAESGHSIFAVDPAGKKLWGARWIDLCGARCLANDGKRVFMAGEGGWIGNETRIYRIDPATFTTRLMTRQSHTAGPLGRGGGLSGLAAREGRVYAAFNGQLHDFTAPTIPAGGLDTNATTVAGLAPAQLDGLLGAAEPKQPWITWPLPAGPDEPLRIAWREPQPIGTILSPHRLEVAALDPAAAFPGDVRDDSVWKPLEADFSSPAFKVYTATGGVTTRALRVKVLDAVDPWKVQQPQAPLAAAEGPPQKFLGLRIMDPGWRNVTGTPDVSVSSGTVLAGGAWENVQDRDIGPAAPAVYTMRFEKPQTVRALAVRDPLFVTADVEVQRVAGGEWVRCGSLNGRFPYRQLFGLATLDLGSDRSLTGVRLKVTQPAVAENADVKKRTGQARTTCGLGGIVLLGPGATDPAVQPDLGRRLVTYDARSGAVKREVPVPPLSGLAFAADGRLLAVSDNRVVTVDPQTGATSPLISAGLVKAAGLTCDTEGGIYVSDEGDHVVKRFDSAGKPAGTIGLPGGLAVGPYDPRHMSHPMGLAFDSRGRLWVAEHERNPKKISVWKPAGKGAKLDAFFVGSGPYGGGMTHIDPRRPSRAFLETMEFEIDWDAGTSRIKNILSRGTMYDRPLYVNDRLYLVAEPHGFYTWYHGCMEVALHKDDRAVPVAAAGKAENWDPLKAAEMQAALGDPQLAVRAFVWSDLNGDGKPQADEIELGPESLRLEYGWAQNVGVDLALQFPNLCLAPVEIRSDGVPIYSFKNVRPTPGPMGDAKWLPGKKYHAIGLTHDDRIIEVGPVIGVQSRDGTRAWSYPEGNNACYGVNSNKNSPPIADGVLVGSLEVMGHGTLPNIGEFFGVQTNRGQVYLFTVDGLFIAELFHDNREGTGGFNFPEAKRGMSVARASLQQEHFGGALTQVDDGRVFLVVGHNHSSVVRIDGLDGIERFEGKVPLGERTGGRGVAAGPAAAVAGELRMRQAEPRIDGDLADWRADDFVAIRGNAAHAARAALATDGKRLLCAFDVQGRDDLVNEGDEPKMLFRSGDSIDVQLGPDRTPDATPVPGDLRLMITRFEGRPIAVLYRYAVPGTPAEAKHTFASPVGRVDVDVVRTLDDADIAIVRRPGGYAVEAAIPWAALGLEPGPAGRLRCDLGVLFANDSGSGIAERVYWSNKESGTVSDVPEEIRLKPHLWGRARVEDAATGKE